MCSVVSFSVSSPANVTRLLSGFAINLTNGRVPSCGASPVRSYNVEKVSSFTIRFEFGGVFPFAITNDSCY